MRIYCFFIITKQGVNEKGKVVHYVFNYAAKATTILYPFASGKKLLKNQAINKNSTVEIAPWGIKIIEEQ